MAIFKSLGTLVDVAGKGVEYSGKGVQFMGKGAKFAGDAAKLAGEGAALAGKGAKAAGELTDKGFGLLGKGVEKTGSVVRKATDRAPELGEKLDTKILDLFNDIKKVCNTEDISSNASGAFYLAVISVAVSTANADGEISTDELEDIELLCQDLKNSGFDCEKDLQRYLESPLTCSDLILQVKALPEYEESPEKVWKFFVNLIIDLSEADGDVSHEEKDFLASFKHGKAL